MKDLFESSVINKCTYGVKLLGKGYLDFKKLNLPMHLEVSDASQSAIEAIKEAGGSIKVVYHTETTLKKFIKPHKFLNPNVKIPMPPPDKVLKLEKIRDKGVEVEYPTAPWYEEYKAKILAEEEEAKNKKKTPGEILVPEIPVDRSPNSKPRYEKKVITRKFDYLQIPKGG